ncbi:MAG: 50S ribosomal protein L22 [Bacillota bacterium]|nr:50S ribosomal protein L22 [Bacillota bacterium]
MKTKAVAKYLRISPRKLKPVCDLVRGKDAKEAVAILKFTPRKSAGLILKVLESAMANAENNHDMNADSLYVAEIYANQGPRMRRYKAGSRGMANPRIIRTSHIGVVVAERE